MISFSLTIMRCADYFQSFIKRHLRFNLIMSTLHHSTVPSDPNLRVKALESLLVEKGLVDPKTLDELVDLCETKIGSRNGAKVVA